ncbi:MAG TPA: DUF554 domain-containing protein [Spirochaetota bacterium]|nr:DUF554 domain-containing protein [Spirochaetota bacterium]HPJ34906.1 DUF554 domain-containing protein [Spirochaetota bacterium]
MIGLGTIVNTISIIAGGSAGAFLKNGLPERYRETVMQAIGLSVIMVGISGTLQGMYRVAENGTLDRKFIMLMIFSLVAGALIGEFFSIEDRLNKMGNWFQKKYAAGSGRFAEGFVTASLVYCVGAMAIVGSLEDGLIGNTATLFAKSILDGISAVIFAATMGIGVAFAALPVFIYQGTITIMAGFIKPWLTPDVISQTSLVGSILIMAIGINLLDLKRIKVGNLLPAIFIPLIYYVIITLVARY